MHAFKLTRTSDVAITACALAAFGLAGCGGGSGPATSTPSTGSAETPQAGAAVAEDDSPAVQLAKLSPDDRALAEKQKKCPVGGELGSMGVPIKVMVGERPVFICCEGCREDLLNDPDKYLAILDASAADASTGDEAAKPSTTPETPPDAPPGDNS
jgi:hypothetical protein